MIILIFLVPSYNFTDIPASYLMPFLPHIRMVRHKWWDKFPAKSGNILPRNTLVMPILEISISSIADPQFYIFCIQV